MCGHRKIQSTQRDAGRCGPTAFEPYRISVNEHGKSTPMLIVEQTCTNTPKNALTRKYGWIFCTHRLKNPACWKMKCRGQAPSFQRDGARLRRQRSSTDRGCLMRMLMRAHKAQQSEFRRQATRGDKPWLEQFCVFCTA